MLIVSFTIYIVFHWGRKISMQCQPWLYRESLSLKIQGLSPQTHLYSFIPVFLVLKNRVGDKAIVLKTYFHVNLSWSPFLEIYIDEIFVQDYKFSVSEFDFILPTLKGKWTATFRLKVMYQKGLYFCTVALMACPC